MYSMDRNGTGLNNPFKRDKSQEGTTPGGNDKLPNLHNRFEDPGQNLEKIKESTNDHPTWSDLENICIKLKRTPDDPLTLYSSKVPGLIIEKLEEGFKVSIKQQIETLVIAGGGCKGMAVPGFLQGLIDKGVFTQVKKVIGSSAGAITGLLVASGMTREDIEKINDIDIKGAVVEASSVFVLNKTPFFSSGEGLEKLLHGLITKNILGQIDAYETKQKTLNMPIAPEVQHIKKQLMEDPTASVTFSTLSILSKIIPEIKEFECTATMKTKDSDSQLMMLNAETTPYFNVVTAAHASGALPIAFSPVEIHFQGMQEKTELTDGGIMLNAYTSSVAKNEEYNPISRHGRLIAVFESAINLKVQNGVVEDPKQGVKDCFFDKVVGSNTQANWYVQNVSLASSTNDVHVMPLTGALEGVPYDFTEALTNFDIPKEHKQQVTKDGAAAIGSYLDRRALGSATFNTLNEALYALDFEDLDTLANENKHDFLLQMVRGIRETIAVDLFKIINTAVSEYNDHVTGKKSTRLKVDGESEIMRGIKIYEGFLGEKGLDLFGIRYAARELCASKEPNVQQFVGALEMESVRGQSRLLTSIVEERERLEVSNAARYAIQTVLAPSLVRNGDADKMSKKENIVLLHDTISKLGSAKTKSAFNACLLNFIHNYQNTGIGVQSAPSSIRLAAALLFPSHQENEN